MTGHRPRATSCSDLSVRFQRRPARKVPPKLCIDCPRAGACKEVPNHWLFCRVVLPDKIFQNVVMMRCKSSKETYRREIVALNLGIPAIGRCSSRILTRSASRGLAPVARIKLIMPWPSPPSQSAIARASSNAASFASSLRIASSPRTKAKPLSCRVSRPPRGCQSPALWPPDR